MVSGNSLTVVGNLTADPELRFTQSGTPVTNFTVASTPRVFNRQSEEWEDGDPLFQRVTVWGMVAENVAETLLKGFRVVVIGRLNERHWEDAEGNPRTNYDLVADHVAADLQFHSYVRNEQALQQAKQPPARRPAAKKTAAKRKKATQSRRVKDTPPVEEYEDPWATNEPPF